MSKFTRTLLVLLAGTSIGAIGGYLVGKSSQTPATKLSVSEEDPITFEVPSSNETDTVSLDEIVLVENSSDPELTVDPIAREVSTELPEQPTPPVAPAPSTTPPTTSGSFASLVPPNNQCFADDDELSLVLTLMAEQMERDSLWYDRTNPKKLQDCSGIFHRISQYVEKKCESYTYPKPKKARDSRSLSGWFHENNNLILIEDPVASRNLIRPGSVMFFGGTGKHFKNMTVQQLSAPYPDGIVEHIGVVTEVKKNEEGEVTGYVMMHGRRPGVFAQRSHYHSIEPPRFGFPPLGNWNQQWIAIGYIMSPNT